ncbi:uncharacterized protein TrAFT101_010282 [Trichoderma asperellum]|uniref:uncharacterized protein n=1 Tax=Trichoderma asperellum TaxID=101201 RepID=UPI0033228AAD|nr:hypothetical protein TrAFT101_010282 [Trichoderma asperellum]
MRAGYVLVSEERESGSEYSGSTCCCCSSCESSCSCEEYSEDDHEEEEDDDGDDEVVIEEEEEEGYWSDCSACWARRIIGRRGRTGRTNGNQYMNIPRTVEERDSLQGHRHRNQREQHRGRNETPQRDQRNANRVTFRSTNSIINGSDNNGHSAAETPSFRGLLDRIVSTTRQLRQGEEHTRHLRSWIRVLEDLQRLQRVDSEPGANTTAVSAPRTTASAVAGLVPNTSPTMAAARAGQQSPSSGTALGRAATASGTEAEAQTRAYPRRRAGREWFMSGGRSTSIHRRRRLR